MSDSATILSAAVTPADVVHGQPWPEIDLRHLLQLTDDTGMFQHALYAAPDPNHGYCIDDNARALIAALLHARLRGYDERVVPLQRYLAFLAYAFNEKRGTFRNFMGYDRQWLEEEGSQDSQGRTLWALGMAVRLAPNDTVRGLARSLLEKGLPAVEQMTFLRSRAFALLGLDAFVRHEPDRADVTTLRDALTEQLFAGLRASASNDWPWWEDTVTYDNAKLPHALLCGGHALRRDDMMEAALRSLRWLLRRQTRDGHLSIIGNQGWMRRDGFRASFDQQPLEASAMVHACLAAAEITGDSSWAGHAWTCFEWFRGHNDLGIPIYDPETGGCQDGLNADGPNENQGAESSLAYLLSVLELHHFHDRQRDHVGDATPATIGFAVAGASKFASFCLDHYRRIEGLAPRAVWSGTPAAARSFAQAHHVLERDTLNDLLDDPQVDLVHIAGIPALHAEHALAALSRGKHVLVEKPIALHGADAVQIMQTAARRDRRLGVNFVMRHGPLALPVKQLIASNVLGAPLRGSFTNRAGDAGLPADHWFWNEEQSGGIFVEHGVHFFDLARWWLGESRVLSATRLTRPGTALVDQVAADLLYGSATTVTFYHGFCQGDHLDQQDFRLIFERGELLLSGWIASQFRIEAVLDEAGIEQLCALMPDAELRTIERFAGGATTWRRHRREPVDRHVELTGKSSLDKQLLYGRALCDLMTDLLRGISNRRHRLRVSADDGRVALELAREADRVARGAAS